MNKYVQYRGALLPEQRKRVLDLLKMAGPIKDVRGLADALEVPWMLLSRFLRTKVAREAAAEADMFSKADLHASLSSPDSEDAALPQLGISEECLQGLRITKRV